MHGSGWQLLTPVETPVESDVDIDEAVKQILAEMEAEEQDPLEGMGNAQVAEIYNRMTPEDPAPVSAV